MADFKFADNYQDLSCESGARAGFQFQFYCERCNDTWRSSFSPFKQGQAAEWAGRASNMFGGILGGAADTIEGLSSATYGTAHDNAFQAAIEEAKNHFHRCARCYQYVCDTCWNEDAGLCYNCAPSAEVEIEAARASGAVYGVGEKAALEGIREGKKMDVKTRTQLKCPECDAETFGAKFCPECGFKLAQKSFCTECGGELASGAKFCGECGAKQGG